MSTSLTFLGVPLPANQEREIVINARNGVRATVSFANGHKEHFNHITEIHWMYPTAGPGTRVAFESSVLRTGWTYPIDEITAVEVDTSDALNGHWFMRVAIKEN